MAGHNKIFWPNKLVRIYVLVTDSLYDLPDFMLVTRAILRTICFQVLFEIARKWLWLVQRRI